MNAKTLNPDLEKDLIDCQPIKDKVRNDDGYARRLYAALCNTKWYHDSVIHSSKQNVNHWSCSWRYAGGMVSGVGLFLLRRGQASHDCGATGHRVHT